MRFPILLLAAIAALTIGGCTQAQIDRAQAISASADARLAQADQAVEIAQQALDAARQLASQVDSVKAQQALAVARAAIDAATAAKDAAKVAAAGAHDALDAATAAQAAGGSSVDVIVAIVGTLLPSAGLLLAALRKAWTAGTALRQIVAGVEQAKANMPSDQVDKLHAALAVTTDDATKQRVALIKAAA